MEITEIFYPKTRSEWRKWLQTFHQSDKREIWLRRFKKATGKACINYDELVEECLCFGWIDGVIKKLDAESNVQRITPRAKKTFLSELNRQRIWKLQHLGRMTPAGEAPFDTTGQIGHKDAAFELPDWMAEILRADREAWQNFQAFPALYQRLKIGWILDTRQERSESERRLRHLIKMSAQNKRYGTEPLKGIFYE